MDFEELRKKHQQFKYKDFKWEFVGKNLEISFNFSITPDIEFNPQVIFPNVSEDRIEEISKEVLDNFVFNLGLIELISYWKATCSPEVVIKAGFLNEKQIAWWKDILINGLGEFFYQNKIDFTKNDLVKFVVDSQDKSPKLFDKELRSRDLILVGGGKDSVVTLELFKESGKDFDCLLLNPTQAALDIIKTSGIKNSVVVKREIDPKLLELNDQGYLNGHTPFSAYLAFLGSLSALLYDFKNVIVSNESSSNEGNIEYLGKTVNHQYSKSFEFENKFREYLGKYLSPSLGYWSFLRPLTEFQIAKLFSKMDKYHFLFRSCNRGSKTNSWCGECAKCLFAYIILTPFLGDKTIQIFGKDLLADPKLEDLLKQLLREYNLPKPFDCVGLVDETKAALFLIDPQKYPGFKENFIKMENTWNTENNLSKEAESFLKEKLNES